MNNCPKCKSERILLVEYAYPIAYRYDGISEFRCQKCGYRQGRWTGKELKPEEYEPPFGEEKYVTTRVTEYNL